MIRNLQALRAVAAWMVVIHHLRAPLGLGDTLFFAAGVDLFFVLSGVVIVVSTAGRDFGPAAFWRRRAARVVPLYWLVTAALIAGATAGLRPVGLAEWDTGDAISAFLFLPNERADGFPGPLLAVGWTLVFEAFFYAVYGASLGARRRVHPAFASCCAMASLVALGMATGPESFAARVWTSPLLLEFVAGLGVGMWWMGRRGGTARGWIAAPVGLTGLALGAFLLAAFAPDGDLVTPGGAGASWRAAFFGVPAALIVFGALAAETRGLIVRNGWVQTQGAASYAVYLLHMPIIQAAEKAAPGWAAAPIAAVAVALAGVLAHRLIERPLAASLRGGVSARLRAAPTPG